MFFHGGGVGCELDVKLHIFGKVMVVVWLELVIESRFPFFYSHTQQLNSPQAKEERKKEAYLLPLPTC